MNFKKIKPDYYITIKAPMRMQHDLKGTDLLIYAIVFGFSQEEGSWFTGSIAYLMEWTGVSKKTVITSLQTLVERGLLVKRERTTQSGTFPVYKATETIHGGEKITPGGEEITPSGEITTPQSGEEITPNKDITDIDTDIDNKDYPNKAAFLEKFEALWKKYPRKEGRKKALEAYQKALKDGVTHEEISAGLDRYLTFLEKNEVEPQFIRKGSKWFAEYSWEDEYVNYKKQLKPGEIDWDNV